jgi:hypothetical protein
MQEICVFWCVTASALMAVAFSGCSVEWKVGYHGKTGIDDRTQTQLVGTEQDREERRR